jgi:hypothetical protein
VGVVVNRQTLRVAGREIRVRLRGMAELAFERAAEFCERRPGEMQSLEDECRPSLELPEDAADFRGPAERRGTPGDALRVRGDVDLLSGFDEAEGRLAQAAGAEKPLDLRDGE